MFVKLLAQAKARQAPPLLQTSLAAALISRWTASLSHAAMHAFAASLLAQDCSNHTNVEGNQPTLSQVLAEAPLHATASSRLPARSYGAPAAWRLTSNTVLVRDSRGKRSEEKKKNNTLDWNFGLSHASRQYGSLPLMLQPCLRNVGLARFWNGTSEDHGNNDGLLTLRRQRHQKFSAHHVNQIEQPPPWFQPRKFWRL